MGKDDVGKISYEEIRLLLHENAEKGFIHPSHRVDMQRFYYLMQGDERAVDDASAQLDASRQGTLSKDPLRNMKYLFVVDTGFAARFAVEAGLPLETAYSISDVFIMRADEADSVEQIKEIHRELYETYLKEIRALRSRDNFSKPVLKCLTYIDSHFNEKITLDKLSSITGLNPRYLAGLFKKETGETLGQYLTRLRIETAKALLRRTDYSYLRIAYSLAFCSQSHFIKTFRKETGMTPGAYREKYYNTNFTL